MSGTRREDGGSERDPTTDSPLQDRLQSHEDALALLAGYGLDGPIGRNFGFECQDASRQPTTEGSRTTHPSMGRGSPQFQQSGRRRAGGQVGKEVEEYRGSLERKPSYVPDDSPTTAREMMLSEELAGLREKYETLLEDRMPRSASQGGRRYIRKFESLDPHLNALETDRWFRRIRLYLRDRSAQLSDGDQLDFVRVRLPYPDQREWMEGCTNLESLHHAFMRFSFPYADLWGEYCSCLYFSSDKRFLNWHATSCWALSSAQDLAHANRYHNLGVPDKALDSIIRSAIWHKCPAGTDLFKFQEASRTSKTLHELCTAMKNFEDLNRRKYQALADTAAGEDASVIPRRFTWELSGASKGTIYSKDSFRTRVAGDRQLSRIDEGRRLDMMASRDSRRYKRSTGSKEFRHHCLSSKNYASIIERRASEHLQQKFQWDPFGGVDEKMLSSIHLIPTQ